MKSAPGGLPGDYTIRTPLFMKRVSPRQKRRCIRCGAGVGEGKLLCRGCRRAHPNDSVLSSDALYFLSCLSLIAALLIINPGLHSGELLDPSAARGSATILLLILPPVAMLPGYLTSPRLFLLRSHLEALSFTIGVVLLIGGVALLIFASSPLYIFITLAGALLFFPSRILLKRLRLEITAAFLLGTLLIFFSFMRSVTSDGGETGLWFLTDGVLASAGLILLFTSTTLFLRRLELQAKAALPHTIMTAGFVTLGPSLHRLWGVHDNFTAEGLLPVQVGLLLLFMGAAMYAQKRWTEHTIEKNLKSVEGALERAEKFFEEGHLFYALQHADRGLKENLLGSIGSSEVEGIIHKIETPSPSRAPDTSPEEYEIAHSEKASLLVAQYNIPGAVAEYMEAIKHNPDYLEPYLDLASLLSTVPGRDGEALRFLNYYLASKLLRLSRWMAEGLPLRYVRWAERSYVLFKETLRLKMDILKRIGNPQEVWRFYALKGGPRAY